MADPGSRSYRHAQSWTRDAKVTGMPTAIQLNRYWSTMIFQPRNSARCRSYDCKLVNSVWTTIPLRITIFCYRACAFYTISEELLVHTTCSTMMDALCTTRNRWAVMSWLDHWNHRSKNVPIQELQSGTTKFCLVPCI